MMKNRVCLLLIAALVFSVFAALPIPAYAPSALPHADTYKSDTSDYWWAGAAQANIDGSGYIVPPNDAVWSPAVFCWEHSSWNTNLNPLAYKNLLINTDPKADWIWKTYQVTLGESYTGDIVFFKKDIDIPADAYDIQADLLIMTSDNAYYFYVNDDWSGTPKGIASFISGYNPTNFYYIADGTNHNPSGTNSVPYETLGNLYPYDAAINTAQSEWASIEKWSITSLLHTGENWLQIVSINEHAPPQGVTSNPAGLIYKVVVSYKTPLYILTVQTNPLGLTPVPTTNPVGDPPGTYPPGTSVTVTAQDVDGYIFVYWDIDGTAQDVGDIDITITMNADHTVTAHYWPELEFETFMTDSSFKLIEGFDTVWTPKDMRKTTFKLASTNPGQFMWNIVIENTWPDIIDTLTIDYDIDPDFILKGADPIQVHTGYGKTGTRIDATVTYGQTGTITITDIASGAKLYITLHLEYGPARDYFDKAEMLAWKADHEPNIFTAGYTATSDGLTATGTKTTTLPDPLIILAVEEQ